MSVLTACQSALVRMIGKKPATVFSSTEQTVVEVADLVNEVAADIMKGHDWQALTEIYDITGDGAATAFPFPDDYDRMVLATDIYDANSWAWGYDHITSIGEWIMHTTGAAIRTPGAWMVRKDQFQFSPTPSAGQIARFAYISNLFARDTIGTPKAAFTEDTDTFALDDRLLTLGLIWRWRAQKKLDYAEDMQTYEIALSQEQARDKGAKVIRSRVRRGPPNLRVGWPGQLGPDLE